MSKHRFSTGLTYTSSRKVFHDGCAKRDIFSQQILNRNRLCLAHCALNRSFTVFTLSTYLLIFGCGGGGPVGQTPLALNEKTVCQPKPHPSNSIV